ncbi:putative fumarate hydratase [Trypanosoma cruzi]|nr:putative fumarate hydratase [Trypanosoma cruzi]
MRSLGVVRSAMRVHCVHERPRRECYHSRQAVAREPQYGWGLDWLLLPLQSFLMRCDTGWIHLQFGRMLAQRLMRGSNGRIFFDDDDVRTVFFFSSSFFSHCMTGRGGTRIPIALSSGPGR